MLSANPYEALGVGIEEYHLPEDVRQKLIRDGIKPRRLFFTAAFRKWVEEVIPTLPAKWTPELTASDQLEQLLEDFCSSLIFAVPGNLRCLAPKSSFVWELKTGDLRVIGWFPRFDWFVCDLGEDANRLHPSEGQTDWALYAAHVTKVEGWRTANSLLHVKDEEPSCVISF